jgi:uncharacterized RDD family membrane protein YckC
MAAQDNETPRERKPKYVWDQKKLIWREATEIPTEEEKVEPEEEASAEPGLLEEIPEEEVYSEGVAVAAEAEEEEVEYKGALIRMGAAIIDFIVLSILSLILRYTVGQVVALPGWVLPIYGLLYFVGFWSWRGQTPGKMLIGAKIVRLDGNRIDPGRAFLRYIVYLMPLYAPIVYLLSQLTFWFFLLLPLIGVIVIGFSRQKRGIQDLVAGTSVINTRRQVWQPGTIEEAEPEPFDSGETDKSE